MKAIEIERGRLEGRDLAVSRCVLAAPVMAAEPRQSARPDDYEQRKAGPVRDRRRTLAARDRLSVLFGIPEKRGALSRRRSDARIGQAARCRRPPPPPGPQKFADRGVGGARDDAPGHASTVRQFRIRAPTRRSWFRSRASPARRPRRSRPLGDGGSGRAVRGQCHCS